MTRVHSTTLLEYSPPLEFSESAPGLGRTTPSSLPVNELSVEICVLELDASRVVPELAVPARDLVGTAARTTSQNIPT